MNSSNGDPYAMAQMTECLGSLGFYDGQPSVMMSATGSLEESQQPYYSILHFENAFIQVVPWQGQDYAGSMVDHQQQRIPMAPPGGFSSYSGWPSLNTSMTPSAMYQSQPSEMATPVTWNPPPGFQNFAQAQNVYGMFPPGFPSPHQFRQLGHQQFQYSQASMEIPPPGRVPLFRPSVLEGSSGNQFPVNQPIVMAPTPPLGQWVPQPSTAPAQNRESGAEEAKQLSDPPPRFRPKAALPRPSTSTNDAASESSTETLKAEPTGTRGPITPTRKQKRANLFCQLCKSNQETPTFYYSHVLRDKHGIVRCPILRDLVCALCGATGDIAHTAKYCPLQKGSSVSEKKRSELVPVNKDEDKKTGEEDGAKKGNDAGEVYQTTRTAAGGYSLSKF